MTNFSTKIKWLSDTSFELLCDNENGEKFSRNYKIEDLKKYTLLENFKDKNPQELIDYFKNNPLEILRMCESNFCLLNYKSFLRKMSFYPLFGNKDLCLTLLFGSGHTEINSVVDWLKKHKNQKLILRIACEPHITEIININKNKTVLSYDYDDANKERSKCFLMMYIRWKIIYELLKSISNNVKIEIHSNIDTLEKVPDYHHFDFSFDNTDDRCGMTECIKLRDKHKNNHMFVGTNNWDDFHIFYNNYVFSNVRQNTGFALGIITAIVILIITAILIKKIVTYLLVQIIKTIFVK